MKKKKKIKKSSIYNFVINNATKPSRNNVLTKKKLENFFKWAETAEVPKYWGWL